MFADRPVRGWSWFATWPCSRICVFRCPGLGRPAGQAQLAGDQHALDLRGALAYLEDLRVAVEAADRGLVHEAVAAEYLGSGPRVVHRRVRRDQLGDRGLLLARLARPPPR